MENDEVQRLLGTSLAALGPGPRPDRLSVEEIARRAGAVSEARNLSALRADTLRALVLLWHDHLDASHSISQEVRDADGSYIHGIMHRREPDYSNAKYWFHRVGAHPVFAKLPGMVRAIPCEGSARGVKDKLAPGKTWDSFLFIDACESAERRGADEGAREFLRKAQRAEFEALLGHLLQ